MTDDNENELPEQRPTIDEQTRLRVNLNRRSVLKAAAATGVGMSGLGGFVGGVAAAPGDQIGQVTLPSHTGAVGITFDGQYVYTLDGLASSTLQVYTPPAGGTGTATLEAEKAIVDPSNNSVSLSAVEWDPTRSMLWGAYNGQNAVYLVDVGDPTDGTEDAVASFEFAPNTGGFSLTDGLAYDGRDDTLWYSPDVHQTIWHFQPDGTQIGTIQPKNADGNNVGVSGVAVGADLSGRPTLYIGKHGPEKILRVHADDGSFVSEFATAGQRIEDLACDPVTYAPNEAILTIFTGTDHYLAFEVEDGTCPIAGEACADCPADFTFKYEWVEDEEAEGECLGEFVIYDDDDNEVESVEGLELVSVACDEDGEPQEACFETTICELEYEVKAGRETETETVAFEETGGEFCVSGLEEEKRKKTVTHAISNIEFSCPEESN